MPTKKWDELRGPLAARVGEEALEVARLRADAEVAAAAALPVLAALAPVPLAELRRRTEHSQVEVAATMGVSQPNVSRIERGADWKASTLRAYLEALGGRLYVLAVVDGEVVSIDLDR